jgi:hypothetical protein
LVLTAEAPERPDVPWQARLPFFYGYAIVAIVFRLPAVVC